MNIFRLIADMLHLAAICTLLYRIKVSRNVVGKSPYTNTLTIALHTHPLSNRSCQHANGL